MRDQGECAGVGGGLGEKEGRIAAVCEQFGGTSGVVAGLYGLDVALVLSEQAGLEVMVANPRAVRHFAQAMMQRSKNDQLDAVVLREFAARMPFKPWVRPKQNTLALWAIARRLEALTAVCTAEKNRRHAAGLSGGEAG